MIQFLSVIRLRGHILTPLMNGGFLDLPDGVVSFNDEIVSVARRASGKVTDLRPHIIIPGFVDLHAHVPQLAICGAHPGELLGWLRKWVFPLEKRFRGERAKILARAFFREMVQNGTTSAALYTSAWPDGAEACFDAAREARVHAWIGMPLMDVGTYRHGNPIRELERLSKRDSPDIRCAVTPRFALSCTPKLLEAAGAMARGLPVMTHLNEQRPEIAEVRRRFRAEYIDVYDRAGLVTDRSILAHAVWMNSRDWKRIAERGAAIAHCPGANIFLGSGVFDWPAAKNARFALGSDVGAGPDLSMYRVARSAWGIHFTRWGVRIEADELMRKMTVDGARILGMPVGSLEPGLSADLQVLDWERIVPPGAPAVESTEDLLSRIVHRGGRSAIREVFVRGRRSA